MAFLLTKNTAGFTLIEMVLVIAVISILSTVVALNIGGFHERQALSNATDEVVALVNEARSRTLLGEGNTQYGVHFESSRAVLFAGSTYDPDASNNREVTLGQIVEIDQILLAGGGADAVFLPVTGGTEESGTLVVRRVSTIDGAKTLTLGATGIISSD